MGSLGQGSYVMTTLSALKAMELTIDVEFGPLTYSVTYGLENFVSTVSAAPTAFVLATVKRWDLTDDDQVPIPITEQALAEVPYPFLTVVANAVQRDAARI